PGCARPGGLRAAQRAGPRVAQVPVHRPRVPRGPAAPGLAGARGGAAVPRRVGQAPARRVQVRGLLPEDRRSGERAVTSTGVPRLLANPRASHPAGTATAVAGPPPPPPPTTPPAPQTPPRPPSPARRPPHRRGGRRRYGRGRPRQHDPRPS